MTDEEKADILFHIMLQFPDRTYLDPSDFSGYSCDAMPNDCHECPFFIIICQFFTVNLLLTS